MKHLPIPTLDSKLEARFFSYIEKGGDCWAWTGVLNNCGRATFWVPDRMYVASRIMYKLHHGVDPGSKKVCHTCDNPACVNPEHLWLGTQRDNVADCVTKGRQTRLAGGRNPQARLTVRQVKKIRLSTEKSGELAERFGVTPSQIWRIRSGKQWKMMEAM